MEATDVDAVADQALLNSTKKIPKENGREKVVRVMPKRKGEGDVGNKSSRAVSDGYILSQKPHPLAMVR